MKPHPRRLLTPDECIRLPGPLKAGDRITQAGDMIVYAAGCPAIRGRQPLYFQDPAFKARAAVPPPPQSDVLLHPPQESPVPAPPGVPDGLGEEKGLEAQA
jgi:type IV secretion system protein VirD4